MQRVIGVVLLVVGVALLIVGMNSSESVTDQASEFFTGRFTDTTLWYIIGGIAVGIAGLGLLVFGGRIGGKRALS